MIAAATLFHRCVYQPEAGKMPQKSIRLGILALCTVVVIIGGMIALVYVPSNREGQVVILMSAGMGYLIAIGKLAGLGDTVTKQVAHVAQELNENISDTRHKIVQPINAAVLGLRNIEDKTIEIDKKADVAAEKAKVVADKLEAAPAMPTTMGEWEAAMERVAESAAEKVCGRYFEAQKGTGI